MGNSYKFLEMEIIKYLYQFTNWKVLLTALMTVCAHTQLEVEVDCETAFIHLHLLYSQLCGLILLHEVYGHQWCCCNYQLSAQAAKRLTGIYWSFVCCGSHQGILHMHWNSHAYRPGSLKIFCKLIVLLSPYNISCLIAYYPLKCNAVPFAF